MYYSGQGPDQAAPDIGDSAVLELIGLGGLGGGGLAGGGRLRGRHDGRRHRHHRGGRPHRRGPQHPAQAADARLPGHAHGHRRPQGGRAGHHAQGQHRHPSRHRRHRAGRAPAWPRRRSPASGRRCSTSTAAWPDPAGDRAGRRRGRGAAGGGRGRSWRCTPASGVRAPAGRPGRPHHLRCARRGRSTPGAGPSAGPFERRVVVTAVACSGRPVFDLAGAAVLAGRLPARRRPGRRRRRWRVELLGQAPRVVGRRRPPVERQLWPRPGRRVAARLAASAPA